MVIVREQQTLCKKILGKQQIVPKVKYSLASYCFYEICEDGVLICNNLTREIVLEENFSFLSFLNNENDNFESFWIENWYYTPVDFDDNKLCTQLLDAIKIIAPPISKKQDYTILTTLDCNARCFYCYEMDGRKRTTMSLQTAQDVADFIINRYESGQTIHFHWFGGEPLCNYQAIDLITEKINMCGIDYVSSIITNGLLFTPEIIQKAKKWNLTECQITIDGTEEVYNKTKNYVYAETINPFYCVLENIENLLKSNIKVNVRLNVGFHNSEDLHNLIDLLYSKFDKYAGLFVYSHLLFNYDHQGNLLFSDKELIELQMINTKIFNHLKNLKLLNVKKLKSKYITNHCMADSKNALCITPVGNITKCEHFTETHIIGSIYSDAYNDEVIKDWKTTLLPEEICDDCPYFIDCIRLKNCPNTPKKCNEFQKQEKLRKLKLNLINSYNEFKK